MKKILLFSLNLLLISLVSNATIHVVSVANFSFSPATITNVIVGDTVRWEWVSGTHTTTCEPASQGAGNSLPSGAATWNSPITAGAPTFDYKVTVAGTYKYWCIPHKPEMAGTFEASGTLPVTLTSFAVNSLNSNVSLNWKTASEQNTDYFSVRRSLDGSEYTEIARIPAAGNSAGEKSYSFTDTKVSSAQQYYYYSLAIVDKDGKRTFSDTRLFKNKLVTLKLITSLSPNPVSGGHLMMRFNADKEGKMNVKVIDAEGKSIISTLMQAYPGVNSGHLHLGNLSSGSYSIVCMLNGTKETHQVIVK
ncbi:MAG TPA: T9SS type A sorting domain-containing protein [Segetibacter sp.]|nr:T9SS type A sorting domain-containing protein [Segetibacter sp.]